ncbi:MAG: SDR family oxidoreductase [Armatimonadota bacterium]|nr:SDR family oxidoreductase [Armatimonadota bacterium]
MRKVLIIGATSVIAQEVAKRFAAQGDQLFLVARHAERLEAVAVDLRVRGAAKVESLAVDLLEFDRHAEIINRAVEALGGLDTVLIAHGILGDQKAAAQDYQVTERELRINFLSVVSLLTPIANLFEQQKKGTIAVISSVAGDRGRQSNYVYGTAKGALNIFLQGLRNRLYPSGVHVVTIKPGFVDTPMTAHLKKGPLFASPETVANGIYRAIVKQRNVVYVPWFWSGILGIIKAIPEFVFKRLKL